MPGEMRRSRGKARTPAPLPFLVAPPDALPLPEGPYAAHCPALIRSNVPPPCSSQVAK